MMIEFLTFTAAFIVADYLVWATKRIYHYLKDRRK
jgi:hypothetical protein